MAQAAARQLEILSTNGNNQNTSRVIYSYDKSIDTVGEVGTFDRCLPAVTPEPWTLKLIMGKTASIDLE